MNADSTTVAFVIHSAHAPTIELSIPLADIEHHSGRYHTGWLKLVGSVVGDGYLVTAPNDDAAQGLASDVRIDAGSTLHYVVQAPKPLPFNPTFWSAVKTTSKTHIHPSTLLQASHAGDGGVVDPAHDHSPLSAEVLSNPIQSWEEALSNPMSSIRVSAQERDECCILTGAPPYHCSSCHIVPPKNADYAEADMICACANLVSDVHPAEKMILRDVRNRIYLNCGLHKAWDAKNVALLASDDRYVRSDYCDHHVATLWSPEQLASRTFHIADTAEGQGWMLFFQDVGPSRAGVDDLGMDEMRSWIGLSHNCHALFAKDASLLHTPTREGLHMMYGAQMIMRYGKDIRELATSARPPPAKTVAVKTFRLPLSDGADRDPAALQSRVVEWIQGATPA